MRVVVVTEEAAVCTKYWAPGYWWNDDDRFRCLVDLQNIKAQIPSFRRLEGLKCLDRLFLFVLSKCRAFVLACGHGVGIRGDAGELAAFSYRVGPQIMMPVRDAKIAGLIIV